MALTRDQELWGIALWVERAHGPDGWFYVAQQQDRLLAAGDFDGAAMWSWVGRRLEKLTESTETSQPSQLGQGVLAFLQVRAGEMNLFAGGLISLN